MRRFIANYPDAPHCFYEVIKDKVADPVYIILDLERDFTVLEAESTASRVAAREATWGAVVRVVEQLLGELCYTGDGAGGSSGGGGGGGGAGEGVRLVPGVNCQVLESSYVHKFSRHLLLYAPGMVGITAARSAGVLHARCLEMDAGLAERELLTYTKETVKAEDHVKYRSVFDVTIYTKNRAMRMAYCCKRNKPHPMLPVLGSSTDVAAHLVNVVPADVFVPPQLLPPIDLAKMPDVDDMAKAARARGASFIGRGFRDAAAGDVGAGEGEDPSEPTPRWQPGHIPKIRALLLADAGVRETLRVQRLAFDDGQEKTLDGGGNTRSFYVKRVAGEPYAYCPYAERIHTNNNMTLVYEHDRRRVYVRCFKCSPTRHADGKPLKVLSIKLPEDTAAAMLAGAGGSGNNATLHACETLVEYREGDVYCDAEGMRPYPTDRIVAIRAGMGAGGSAVIVFLKNEPCIDGDAVNADVRLRDRNFK